MADDFAPVTVTEFLEHFPEFGDVPAAAAQFRLDLAMKSQSRADWGRHWREAVQLMAAHVLAQRFDIAEKASEQGRAGVFAAGFVTAQSAGPGSLSVSTQLPASATGDDLFTAWMYKTAYGQEWLALLAMVVPPCGVVFSPPAADQMHAFYAECFGAGGHDA